MNWLTLFKFSFKKSAILAFFTLCLSLNIKTINFLSEIQEGPQNSTIIETIILGQASKSIIKKVVQSIDRLEKYTIDTEILKSIGPFLNSIGLEGEIFSKQDKPVLLKLWFPSLLNTKQVAEQRLHLEKFFGPENLILKEQVIKETRVNEVRLYKFVILVLSTLSLYLLFLFSKKVKKVNSFFVSMAKPNDFNKILFIWTAFCLVVSFGMSLFFKDPKIAYIPGFTIIAFWTLGKTYLWKNSKVLVSFLLIIFCQTSMARINYKGLSEKYLNEISGVRGEIKRVNQGLDGLNEKVLTSHRLKERLGVELEELERKIQFVKREIGRKRDSQKKLVLGSFLIWKSKAYRPLEEVIVDRIKQRSKEYKKIQRTRLRLVASLLLKKNKKQNQLWNIEFAETDAKKMMNNLENKKNSLAVNYSTYVDAYKKTLEQIKIQEKLRLSDWESGNIKFNYPVIVDSNKIRYEEKGFTFSLGKNSKVTAPEDGKIAYSDKIAMVGNILLIEHPKGMHSVLIGDFDPSKKIGQKVKKGELLGYVKKDINEPDLRFELRKNSKLQDIRKYVTKL